ncbi:DUF7519 family protein [Haloarcula nitratireducens]|uniref:DUF92 domain-containing protein n=1 Tax=Haloarcula nitratireducens TaxID=2487749 RepID=A0AAW4PDI3_9EURY|nr:hypothetical protein [Halomicroarcula nitratireducens]MBX0295736.1 hypothetical protein [Halomicroarcula nitratireducens]
MTAHRPAVLSGALSVLVGAAALALVGTTPAQRLTIGVTLVALVPLALGLELRRRGHVPAALALSSLGTAGVAGALALGSARIASFSDGIELYPGLVGLFVLVLALGPVWAGRERALVSVGSGLLLISVIASAGVYGTDTTGLLVAGVGTVLAWDLAERAVNLGEQVGREAETRTVELTHAGATAAVGGGAILAVQVIVDADVTGLSLPVLASLLGSGLLLTLALYN